MTDATMTGPLAGGGGRQAAPGPMLAADGTPLRRSLTRSLRRQKWRAFLLVAPLLAFILVFFAFPIADMLFRSVENRIVRDTLPRTVAALAEDPAPVPGIGAGSILVFILAIGYYITPELVGGTRGVFISNRIAYHISSSLNWGLAAALGTILLVVVLLLYWIYDRLVGIDNVKLGG